MKKQSSSQHVFARFLRRSIILCAWVSIIFALLMSARLDFSFMQRKSINVFSWSNVFDEEIINAFTKETGIHVNMSYYTSNEELLAKLKATGGEGYDLIIPSDYAVKSLQEEQLLKKIDHQQLDFFTDLEPSLLRLPTDPHNEYALPLSWEIFGLGIDKDAVALNQNSTTWKTIFTNPSGAYKIVMINSPIDLFMIAAYYLYGDKNTLTQAEVAQVKDLLVKQHAWVEAYADFRADYFLATKNAPLAVASSSYILRSEKLFGHIDFVVPTDGSFITIEHCAIPVATKKEALVYQFLNYMYKPDIITHHYKTFALLPTTRTALTLLAEDTNVQNLVTLYTKNPQKFLFFKRLMSEQELNDVWVALKS